MVLKKEIALQIKDLLKENPQGLSITGIVRVVKINRNTAGRYLENLLISGQVEMRRRGMAKIYMLSQRVPLSAVLSISSELIIQLDSNLRIVFANEPFLKLIGTDSKTLQGKNIEYTPVPLVFDEAFPAFVKNIKEGIDGKEWSGEIELSSKDIVLFCRIAPTVFEDGRKGVSVILEDITQHKRARDALQESEERYRTLVDISPNAVLLHRAGKIFFANPAALRLLGATHSDEIIGRNVLDFISASFREIVRKNIQKDLEGRPSPSTELPMIRIDGTPILIEGRGVGTTIGGKPAVQVAIRDITETKRAEEELRRSEETFRSLVHESTDGIVIADEEGRVIVWNNALTRITGIPEDGAMGKLYVDLMISTIVPERRGHDRIARIRKIIDEQLQTGSSSFFCRPIEAEIIRRDGERRYIQQTAFPIRTSKGYRIGSIIRDITERKRAEEALHKSEVLYRTLAEASSDLIFIVGREDLVEYVNNYASALVGKPVNLIIGHPRSSLFPPDVAKSQKKALDRVFETGIPVRNESPLTFNEQIHWFDHILTPLKDSDNCVRSVLGISRDVTQRKRAEIALFESENKYRTLVDRANTQLRKSEQMYKRLLEQSFDAIAIHKGGKIVFLNEMAAKILGAAKPEDLTGRPIFDFIHPDSYKDLEDRVRKPATAEGMAAPVIIEKFLRTDGTAVTVEVMAISFDDNGIPASRVAFREISPQR